MEMEVDLYSISHGYGFCTAPGMRVFFRVEDFQREPDGPLPICGELVTVSRLIEGGKSPRAASIRRTGRPPRLRGGIKSFDASKGWGFIERGSQVYFLHRSDLSVPFLPVIGREATFYAGTRRGKARACYVLPVSG